MKKALTLTFIIFGSILAGEIAATCTTLGSVTLNCVTCQRLLSCTDLCGNEPTYGPKTFCGAKDFTLGCMSTEKRSMICQNCVGDPVTNAWDYVDTCKLGYVCISGSDFY